MVDLVILFSLQLSFQFFRALTTRTVVAKHIWISMFNTAILQALWLVTTYLGVMSIMTMNWWMITGYMLGGVLGTYFSFKVMKHI